MALGISGGFFLPLGGSFTRFCGACQDIFSRRLQFLPVLWRFPGHFLTATAVSPDFVALSWTFCPWHTFHPHSAAYSWMFCSRHSFPPHSEAYSWICCSPNSTRFLFSKISLFKKNKTLNFFFFLKKNLRMCFHYIQYSISIAEI